MAVRERFIHLTCRFAAAETGGAGRGYLLFTACWAAAVFCGVHVATSAAAAKLNAVAKALGGQLGGLR